MRQITINASLGASLRAAGLAHTMFPIARDFLVTASLAFLAAIVLELWLGARNGISFYHVSVFIVCCSMALAVLRAHVTCEIRDGRIRIAKPGGAGRAFAFPRDASVELTEFENGVVRVAVKSATVKYEVFAYISTDERHELDALLRRSG